MLGFQGFFSYIYPKVLAIFTQARTHTYTGSYYMSDQLNLDLYVAPIPGFISKHCRFVDNCDCNRHVFVDGVPAYVYRIGDKAQQRNVIVALLRANLATEAQLSAAFDVALRSVSRWNCKYNKEGMNGLVDKERSGAPEKVTPQLKAQIRDLRAKRVKINEISRLLNIGVGSVCRVLYVKHEDTQAYVEFEELDDSEVGAKVESVALGATCDTTQNEPAMVDKVTLMASNDTVTSPAPCMPVTLTKDQPPLVDPLDRTMDRVRARCGLIEEAAPLLLEGQRIEFAGVLLTLATREMLWYMDVVKKVYKSFGASFYGIRGIFLTFMFMLLLRIKNCEQIREYNPVTLGMLLGLDRAPEVKTLRRKLRVLYSREQSVACMDQMRALRMNSGEPELFATLYIDGHVKAYYGKHQIGATHSGRLHKIVRGCTDYWVNIHGGKPFCVIDTEFNDSMTGMLPDIVKDIVRECSIHGIAAAELIVIFDRGGYSGKVFEQLLSMNVKIITYNRGPVDDVDMALFDKKETLIKQRKYPASPIERDAEIDVYETVSGEGTRKAVVKKTGRVVKLREILILRQDQRVTSLLTNIQNTERSTVEVASELFNRWPQENYLKYLMEEFALDHLHAYGAENISSLSKHPNPEYTKIKKELFALKSVVEKTVGRQTVKRLEGEENAFVKLQKKLKDITIMGVGTIKTCIEKLTSQRALLSTIKERVTISDYKRLPSESRMFHHFLKISAYQIESELVEVVHEYYPDRNGDARTIVASMLKSSGILTVSQGTLMVTLDRQSSPQRTRLLQNLCDHLNQHSVIYPGTQLILRFQTQQVDI
jgi:hypothetical protein